MDAHRHTEYILDSENDRTIHIIERLVYNDAISHHKARYIIIAFQICGRRWLIEAVGSGTGAFLQSAEQLAVVLRRVQR